MFPWRALEWVRSVGAVPELLGKFEVGVVCLPPLSFPPAPRGLAAEDTRKEGRTTNRPVVPTRVSGSGADYVLQGPWMSRARVLAGSGVCRLKVGSYGVCGLHLHCIRAKRQADRLTECDASVSVCLPVFLSVSPAYPPIHTHTRARICTHIHTHARARTHTHTYARTP